MAPTQYTLHVEVSGSGGTSVIGDHVYDEGASVEVLATADAGWTFSHWLLDEVDVGSANPYVLTVGSDHDLVAVFTQVSPAFPWTTLLIGVIAIGALLAGVLIYFKKR